MNESHSEKPKSESESSPLFESSRKDAVVWFVVGNVVLLAMLVIIGLLAKSGGCIPE
jgi:hypothetical protein